MLLQAIKQFYTFYLSIQKLFSVYSNDWKRWLEVYGPTYLQPPTLLYTSTYFPSLFVFDLFFFRTLLRVPTADESDQNLQ